MKIYHGSTVVVQHPAIFHPAHTLDFGNGFYTTTHFEQAQRWAAKVREKRNVQEAYVSVYDFDLESAERDLTLLKFEEAGKDWLHFVSSCRANCPIVENYDIVWGAVANDTVYTTLRLYDLNVLDEEETLKRLKIQKLYDQILFHTEKSLRYCRFVEAKTLEV